MTIFGRRCIVGRRLTPGRARRTAVVAVAVAVSLAVSGCGDDSTSGSPVQSNGLAAAMSSVPGSGVTARYFEYGDFARLRKLGILDAGTSSDPAATVARRRWQPVAGIGASELSPYIGILADVAELNIAAAHDAVTVGMPPNRVTRVDGTFDGDTIAAKLRSLGAKRRTFDGTAGLSFAADNTVDIASKLARRLKGFQPIGQVIVSDRRFETTRNAATLTQVRQGGSRNLLDTGSYHDVADCLGDVVAAIIMSPGGDSRSTIVAVGVRDPSSAGAVAHEVLCVLPVGGQQTAVHAAVAKTLAPSGTDPFTGGPVSEFVSATAVSDQGSLVRAELTGTKGGLVGYLFQGVLRNAFEFWDGSCTAAALARRNC